MKRLLKGVILAALVSGLAAGAYAKDTYVKGHFKKDGTYVQGHHKTTPNRSSTDNYGSKGNTNPWTGKAGTKTPKK